MAAEISGIGDVFRAMFWTVWWNYMIVNNFGLDGRSGFKFSMLLDMFGATSFINPCVCAFVCMCF